MRSAWPNPPSLITLEASRDGDYLVVPALTTGNLLWEASMAKTTSCVVYWLTDSRCVCPWRHGYIGISIDFRRRLHHQRYRQKRKFEATILFSGTWSECRALDKIAKTLTGHVRTLASRKKQAAKMRGIAKPIMQREKMAQAGSSRYIDRKPRSESYERARLAKNAKRAARRAAGLPRLY
jgi:hypothetical protein